MAQASLPQPQPSPSVNSSSNRENPSSYQRPTNSDRLIYDSGPSQSEGQFNSTAPTSTSRAAYEFAASTKRAMDAQNPDPVRDLYGRAKGELSAGITSLQTAGRNRFNDYVRSKAREGLQRSVASNLRSRGLDELADRATSPEVEAALSNFDTASAIQDAEYRARAMRMAGEYAATAARKQTVSIAKRMVLSYLDNEAADKLRELGLDELAEVIEEQGIEGSIEEIADALEAGDYSLAASLASSTALYIASFWTQPAIVTWQWGSIVAIPVDWGLEFFLATILAYASFFRTFLGKRYMDDLVTKPVNRLAVISWFSLRKSSKGRLLPLGLMEFAFFMTSNFIWVFGTLLLIGAIVTSVILILLPYVETASFVCNFFEHPLCTIAP